MAADDGNCRATFGGEILEPNDHVRDSALDPRCLRKGNDDAGETVGLQDTRFGESEPFISARAEWVACRASFWSHGR